MRLGVADHAERFDRHRLERDERDQHRRQRHPEEDHQAQQRVRHQVAREDADVPDLDVLGQWPQRQEEGGADGEAQ